ncbi:DinB family protein [Brachybacterium phenoliresistens]|uniref:DinB family protein n=1 Tax=Brachybacterium phenoliresistens TaxID=396014 RepID=UPI0031CEDD0C
MVIYDGPQDLRRAVLMDVDLSGARLIRTSLAGATMRGADVTGAEIDSPWLLEDEGGTLLINGVDVVPYLQAELDRRWPGRALRRAEDPDGLREAWTALETTWRRTIDQAAAMPEGSVDAKVDGEWSFSQTLRHLVMAIDIWLGRAILHREDALHPIGQPHADYEADGHDMAAFAPGIPAFDDVLAVLAERFAMVRSFLAEATAELLDAPRNCPWDPGREVTVRSCLHVILNEGWEHHRYAVRDLEALAGARERT